MNVIRAMSQLDIRGRRRKISSNGFTLMELMVVLAIVAVAGTATVASVEAYLRKTSLTKAVFQISGELYQVKSQAIRSRQNCSVNFDNVLHNYTSQDPNPNPTVNLSDLRGNVAFTANPDGGVDTFSNNITFDFRGLSTSGGPAQVYVQATDGGGAVYRIYRVQVMPAGAISIRYWVPQTKIWTQ